MLRCVSRYPPLFMRAPMATTLPDLAPLESVTTGLEMALHQLEAALQARDDMHRRQHLALAEKLERVISGIEPLIGTAPLSPGERAPKGKLETKTVPRRAKAKVSLLEDV